MGFSRRMVGAAAAIGLGAAAGLAWINSAPSRVDGGLWKFPPGRGRPGWPGNSKTGAVYVPRRGFAF
jgi:hypothetical protein